MLLDALPHSAQQFFRALVVSTNAPQSVWLIGSRANNRADEQSDTDLLIFGSTLLIDELRDSMPAPADIDALIVYNGNDYSDPWQNKRGSLANLKWRLLTAEVASYKGVRWIPDEESEDEFSPDSGELLTLDERACRIWAAPEHHHLCEQVSN
ncbi:nucleotidyltransferase domain-containing protein [Acidovorax kalamii]|uniref:nucleotidyltransferase domain-containing protein n=1 Tax=Acidovorax kalamii TaxID=2004485 RepID=UPI002091930E|nr:nucleotidyltransferase domain-containing protein [Acidovorax kalamii]MCO5354941.1 nucleotidyltransferase domain-containing protein [Acidovorax kalamii]